MGVKPSEVTEEGFYWFRDANHPEWGWEMVKAVQLNEVEWGAARMVFESTGSMGWLELNDFAPNDVLIGPIKPPEPA